MSGRWSLVLRLAAVGAGLIALGLAGGAESRDDAGAPRPQDIEGTIISVATRHTPAGAEVLLLTAPSAASPAEGPDLLGARGGQRIEGMAVGMGADGLLVEVLDSRFRPGSRWIAGQPTTLLRVHPDRRPEVLRDDLPGDAMALETADLDGDGEQEVLLAAPGRLIRLGLGASQVDVRLATSAGIDPNGRLPRVGTHAVLAAARGGLWIDEGDALAFFAPDPQAESWRRRQRVEVPASAIYRGGEVLVFHPHPRAVRRRAGTPLALSLLPDPKRARRVGWQILRLDGQTPGLEETWLDLAGPTMVIGSQPLVFGGRPAMALAGLAADRLRLSPRARLAVYAFEASRSRVGRKALLAVDELDPDEARSARFHSLDADRDGREDLLLTFPSGNSLRWRLYRGRENGGFERRVRRGKVKLGSRGPVSEIRLLYDDDGRWHQTLLASRSHQWLCRPEGEAVIALESCRERALPAPDLEADDKRSRWSGWVDLAPQQAPTGLVVVTGGDEPSQVFWVR